MFSLVLSIHIILCLMLIALVLKQQGKGADMGATFGGGSNTVFGAGGANDLVVKMTTILAICFFVSSILLIHLYRDLGVSVKENNSLTSSSVVTGAPVANAPAAETSSTAATQSSSVAAEASSSVTSPIAQASSSAGSEPVAASASSAVAPVVNAGEKK